MKVEILTPTGYCHGVTLAIKTALKAKEENQDKPVYVLGMLVHNEETIKFLEEKGIITLTNENNDLFKLIELIPNHSVIVFTAHGHSEKLDDIAREKGLTIYDATCPMVKNNISLIKTKISEGYQVLFIGKKNHPETEAMLSISDQVYFYDSNILKVNQKTTNCKIFVANQTTLNYEDVKVIHQEILEVFPDAIVQNEVCNTTRLRQSNLRLADPSIDLIYVIGSKRSNNTMKLLEIAETTFFKADVRLILNIDDINQSDLVNKKHILLVSGASTPKESVDMIYNYLVSLN